MNSVFGSWNTCCGEPCCSMMPLRMMMTLSDSASASSWSCVTKMAVKPRRACEQLQFGAHAFAQIGVEVRQWLVEQDDARMMDERARERDALLLAAAERRGGAVLVIAEADEFEDRGGLFLRVGFRDAGNPQRKADIAADRHVRPDRIGLKHHADLALLGHDEALGLVVEDDLARRS